MLSAGVASQSRTKPRTAEVIVVLPGLRIPRIDLHTGALPSPVTGGSRDALARSDDLPGHAEANAWFASVAADATRDTWVAPAP